MINQPSQQQTEIFNKILQEINLTECRAEFPNVP